MTSEASEAYVAALKSEITNLSDFNEAIVFASAKTIKELRAENAALREIAAAVAKLEPMVAWGSEWRLVCGVCHGHQPETDFEADEWEPVPDDAPVVHAADCPVTKARALLAKEAR